MRPGARKLIAQALDAEVAELLATYADQGDVHGQAVVVHNGHHPERKIQTGIGLVTVRVPKVRSRQGDPIALRSALVPPYVRKTASFEAAIPWLYLKGISTGDMQTALDALVGPEVKGLSASTVARLKQIWREILRLGAGPLEPENTRGECASTRYWRDGVLGGGGRNPPQHPAATLLVT